MMLGLKIGNMLSRISSTLKIRSAFKIVDVDPASYIISYQLRGKNITNGSEPENLVKAGLESSGFSDVDQTIILNCLHHKLNNKFSFIKDVFFSEGKFTVNIINERSGQLLHTTPTEALSDKLIKDSLNIDDFEKMCLLQNMENNYLVNKEKIKNGITRNIKVYHCKV